MTYLAALIAGLSIGVLYFGALWETVRRVPHARSPGLLLGVSWVARMALLGLTFGVLAWTATWLHVALALVGLLLVRTVMVHRIRPGLSSDRR